MWAEMFTIIWSKNLSQNVEGSVMLKMYLSLQHVLYR